MKITSCNKTIMAALFAGLALVNTGSAQLTTVYQDTFDRNGILDGTQPDTANTNSNVWQDTQGDFGVGTNTYVTTTAGGGSVSQDSSGAIDGNSYLPVNGSSGVTLDGTKDFALSATVTNAGNTMGIVLADSPYSGGNQFYGDSSDLVFLAQIGTNSSGIVQDLNGPTIVNWHFSLSSTETLELAYSAETGLLSYIAVGTTLDTLSVTPTQISDLTLVGIGTGSYGSNAGTFSNFNLAVASGSVPEPGTIWSVALGLLGLVGFQVRGNRKA